MRHTVAAIFESETQANQARSELIDLGVPNDDIFVRYDTGQTQYSGSGKTGEEDSGIGGFFKRLFGFGDDDDRTTYYSRAIGEGRYLVAVDAADENQAERAADLMQRLGAVDIDDDADQLDLTRTVSTEAQTPSGRSGVRIYARQYDIPTEEKTRLRSAHGDIGRNTIRRTDLGAQQLAASQKPHPHLETMEDDPYTPMPDPTRQQE